MPAFPLISPWSPTRLEGMETPPKDTCVGCAEASPTRLEGMETQDGSENPSPSASSPTRLEGMETQGENFWDAITPCLRPALRGWKQCPTCEQCPGAYPSPTRLEGMETETAELPPLQCPSSPTRLEGMETAMMPLQVTSSPKRLRPALRGWKRQRPLKDNRRL